MATDGIITLIALGLFALLGGLAAYRFNAEFRRCVWMEFSISRLSAMTIVLLAFFMLAYVVASDGPRYVLTIAVVMFFLIAGLWAIFKAASAVPEEIHSGTWDAQRLSGIGAWNLTWGKLLGATAFMWFGGLICVGAAIWAAPDFNQAVVDWTLRIGCVLGGQAVALCVALAQVRKNRTSRNVRYPFMAGQIVTVMTARLVGVLNVLQDTNLGNMPRGAGRWMLSRLWSNDIGMSWYGLKLREPEFQFLTVFGLVALGLFGAWRLMRIELRYHVQPWAWPVFTLLCLGYAFGFVMPYLGHFLSPLLPLSLVAFAVLLILTYIAAFAEPKEFMRYRWAIERLKARNWRGALSMMPLWLPGMIMLPVAAAFAITAVASVPLHFCFLGNVPQELQQCANIAVIFNMDPTNLVDQMVGFLIGLLIFFARDLCLIVFLNLAANPKQADLIAWLYMVMSYIVAPVIFGALKYPLVLPLFVPLPIMPSWLTIGCALPGFLIAALLLAWRWHRRQRRQVAEMAAAT